MEVDKPEDTFVDDDSADTGDDPADQAMAIKSFVRKDSHSQTLALYTNQPTESDARTRPKGKYVGKSATLCVSFVPQTVNEPEVCEFMQSVKGVQVPRSVRLQLQRRVKVPREHALYDARVAYVVMASKEEAAKCAKKLNEKEWAGTAVHVLVCPDSEKWDNDFKGETQWVVLPICRATRRSRTC